MKKLIIISILCTLALGVKAQMLYDKKDFIKDFYLEEGDVIASQIDKIEKSINKLNPKVETISINGKYNTEEYNTNNGIYDLPYNSKIYYPESEIQTTNHYNLSLITIPAGYTLPYTIGLTLPYDQKGMKDNYYFTDKNTLQIFIDDEELSNPLTFYLDYKIQIPLTNEFVNMIYEDDSTYDKHLANINKGNVERTIALYYDPKYFTLKVEIDPKKPLIREVPNKLNKIVETTPVFYTTNQLGKTFAYYLIPNIENLNKDFNFIKNQKHQEPIIIK